MAETNVSLAYRALVSSLASSNAKIVDADAVASIARKLGFRASIIRNGLVRGGCLLPIYFKGVYYLLDPDEFKTKFLKRKSFEIVAAACSHCFGKNWYYGLGSALYFGGMQRQAPSEFVIITDRHLPVSFEFGGSTFRIRKSAALDYAVEIKEKGLLRFSSPARTIADYLYFYVKEGKQDYAIRVAKNMLRSFPDARKGLNGRLIGVYPPPYHLAVGYAAGQARGSNV